MNYEQDVEFNRILEGTDPSEILDSLPDESPELLSVAPLERSNGVLRSEGELSSLFSPSSYLNRTCHVADNEDAARHVIYATRRQLTTAYTHAT